MKHLFNLILLIIVTYSCVQTGDSGKAYNTSKLKGNHESKIESASGLVADSSYSITVKDSAFYSPEFLKKLTTDKEFRKFRLDSEFIIVNAKDTFYFPDEPPFNKNIFLSNRKDNIIIYLNVKRILLSTIEYSLELREGNNPPVKNSGFADLSPRFFVGPEIDEDSSGEGYCSIEYWARSTNRNSIRIGLDPKNGKTFLCKLNFHIGAYKIDLENFPALKEKKWQPITRTIKVSCLSCFLPARLTPVGRA